MNAEQEICGSIVSDIKAIEGIRLQAIRKLNTLLERMESYAPDADQFHDLRSKADDFAYELGGYVAAENPGERLYFWTESY